MAEANVWRRGRRVPLDVLIITGGPASGLSAGDMARYLESGCCERTRAILLAEGDLQLSPRIADIRTCRDGGEEKDFWLYAESD